MSIFSLTPATSRRSSPNRLGPLARFHRMRNSTFLAAAKKFVEEEPTFS
jgi:hypothetical protein